MNRRDALKSALGAAVLDGATLKLLEPTKPLMLVLCLSLHESQGRVEAIYESLRILLSKTDYPDMPCAVLQPGMDLQIIEDPRGAA